MALTIGELVTRFIGFKAFKVWRDTVLEIPNKNVEDFLHLTKCCCK